MKTGDLVTMPNRNERFGIKTIGLISQSNIIRNRIGVWWSDEGSEVCYEPVKLLEVVNES